jgi:hypothetical protein
MKIQNMFNVAGVGCFIGVLVAISSVPPVPQAAKISVQPKVISAQPKTETEKPTFQSVVAPSDPGALAKPVVRIKAIRNTNSWTPTYRAARNAGYNPTQAQAFSNLCKLTEADPNPEVHGQLCIKLGQEDDAAAKLKAISLASEIYLNSVGN